SSPALENGAGWPAKLPASATRKVPGRCASFVLRWPLANVIFIKFPPHPRWENALSLTPRLQPGDRSAMKNYSRFNGFLACRKTVETVLGLALASDTGLKPRC